MGDEYEKWSIGIADDIVDADGIEVLSFAQADAKVRLGPSGSTDKKMTTVNNVVAYYMKRQQSEAQNAKTTQYVVDKYITPTIGTKKLSRLTTDSIRDWRDELAASRKERPGKLSDSPREQRRKRQASANRILTILKAALNYAEAEGKYRGQAPWKAVKPFKNVDAAKVRYLSADECTRLMNASAPDFRPLVQAALLTGARYGELIAMNCDDYNADAGTVSVYESKSGKTRHIPLNDEGALLFSQLTAGRQGKIFLKANGEPWGQWQQARPLADAAGTANVEGATFHILRHTYGSALAMQGVPMSVIANALGHSSTRMTEKHYAHLSPSYVAETIRANLPKLGIVVSGNVERLKPQARQ